jgi:dienelactone hydrolase
MRGLPCALFFLLVASIPAAADAQPSGLVAPDTVQVASGDLRLTALVWKPSGPGPFPGVLYSHGRGGDPADAMSAPSLGPLFARHGYVFMALFRRGEGLSESQGTFIGDLLGASRGEGARERLQLRLLTTDHLDDVGAGIRTLRSVEGVDPGRVAVVGHSFGGQLSLLAAERDTTLLAVVGFGPAARAWGESKELRERLLAAARRIDAPVLFVYAANDYSTAPGKEMARERARVGKPGGFELYPAVGDTAAEGHELVYRAIPLWEDDVFDFLDRWVASAGR